MVILFLSLGITAALLCDQIAPSEEKTLEKAKIVYKLLNRNGNQPVMRDEFVDWALSQFDDNLNVNSFFVAFFAE